MASFNTTGLRNYAFSSLTAISAFARVNVSASGFIQCAGPTAIDLGCLDLDAGVGEVYCAVRMYGLLGAFPGSKKFIADAAITAWGYVYKSYSGFVTASGSSNWSAFSANAITLGIAAAPSGQPVAATGFGSVLEVVPYF